MGAVIEQIIGRSWEIGLRDEVLNPLGISPYGFGDLGAGHLTGHRRAGPIWWPERMDNPEDYGPAGRVSLSLRGWGHFLNAHLRPNGFLSGATVRRLHTPTRNEFAMGWRGEAASGRRLLMHTGSNTAWFAQAALVPEQGIAVGVVCNAFDKRVEKAVGELTRALINPKTV